MNISYQNRPVEGRLFHISADGVSGTAHFKAHLDGAPFWEHECPNPPCHEEWRVPPGIAGSTLLITVRDNEEEHELLFFINDDGEGVPEKQVVKKFA